MKKSTLVKQLKQIKNRKYKESEELEAMRFNLKNTLSILHNSIDKLPKKDLEKLHKLLTSFYKIR